MDVLNTLHSINFEVISFDFLLDEVSECRYVGICDTPEILQLSSPFLPLIQWRMNFITLDGSIIIEIVIQVDWIIFTVTLIA